MMQSPNVGVGGKDFGGKDTAINHEANNKELFLHCVSKIKRWPRLSSTRFPIFPKGCGFVITGNSGGKYKLDVEGVVYTHSDYTKAKKGNF
jgi:hypothetical protein